MKNLLNTIKMIFKMPKEFQAMETKIKELQHQIDRMSDYVSSYELEEIKKQFETLEKSHKKLDRSVSILFSDRV